MQFQCYVKISIICFFLLFNNSFKIFFFFQAPFFFLDHCVNPKAMFAFKSLYCHFPPCFLNMSRLTQKAWFIPPSLAEAFMDQIEEATGV